MSPTIVEFEAKGWFLSQEGIDLIASENKDISNIDDYITCAEDMDLRLLTTKGFNKTAEKPSEIPSPLVLQVLEVRNVAMPTVNQVETPRLLSVTFTDGSKKKYKAVEVFGKVDCLNLHTPPGTKFLVKKPIEIKDQILILGPDMLTELGGHVQELVQAWRAGKQFLKRYRGKTPNKDGDNDEQGPPPFVPFKVKASNIEKEQKQKKPAPPKDIAQTKNEKSIDKKGKKVKSENKQIERKKNDSKAEPLENKKQNKERSEEKPGQKKSSLNEKPEEIKDGDNSRAKKGKPKLTTDAKKDKKFTKPEKSDKSNKNDSTSEKTLLGDAPNIPEKTKRQNKPKNNNERMIEQREGDINSSPSKPKFRTKETRENTESGISSPTPHSGTTTPLLTEEKKSSRKKKASKISQQLDNKQDLINDQINETKNVQKKEKQPRKKKALASTTKITNSDNELDVEETTTFEKKKNARNSSEKKVVPVNMNDSDSARRSKSKSVNIAPLVDADKENKKVSNSKPKRERKPREPRERGQRKDEHSTTTKAETLEEKLDMQKENLENVSTIKQGGSGPFSGSPPTVMKPSNTQHNNTTSATSRASQPYYDTNQQQIQQPPPEPEYYYHQQPVYAPVVDYNMMVPIDPNTGLPTVMYSYHPNIPHQQQQYMQPMYYMTRQHQMPYNHQLHYTQLYDQDHHDHPNEYRQQQRYQQEYDTGNKSNNNGKNGNSNRGRDIRGRGRGGFKL